MREGKAECGVIEREGGEEEDEEDEEGVERGMMEPGRTYSFDEFLAHSANVLLDDQSQTVHWPSEKLS